MENKTVIQQVEDNEGDYEHQDGVGGSGLWGASVVSSRGVDILPSGGVCAGEAPWSHWTRP